MKKNLLAMFLLVRDSQSRVSTVEKQATRTLRTMVYHLSLFGVNNVGRGGSQLLHGRQEEPSKQVHKYGFRWASAAWGLIVKNGQ